MGLYNQETGEEIYRGEAGLIRDLSREEIKRVAKESRFASWWMKRGAKKFLREDIKTNVSELADRRTKARHKKQVELTRESLEKQKNKKTPDLSDQSIKMIGDITSVHLEDANE